MTAAEFRLKTIPAIVLLMFFISGASPADEPGNSESSYGESFGFDIGAGIQGGLSFYQAGILLPKIANTVSINIHARLYSALTWTTFINMETDETVSFHPITAAGVVSVGGGSPLLHEFIKAYGGMELMAGYTFTPYDDLAYDCGNLLGENFTFAVLGHFGIEFFTAPTISVYIEAGGGYKSILGDKSNPYVIAASWIGSGFGLKMGMRFYLPR